MVCRQLFIVALCVSSICGLGCPPGAHRVDDLEYFDGDALPCMYAGTINAGDAHDHELFYWLFRQEKNDADDGPLVVWLNGGPGASSMLANFVFHGPLRISRGSQEDFRVHLSEEPSWSKYANMLYLDQPVGTGFSYGEPYLTTMEQLEEEFVTFMLRFLDTYPEFKGRDLLLTGESYGGKYLPAFTLALLKHNDKVGKEVFALKSTLIGDPYAAPLTQRTSMHALAFALNIIDASNMPQIAALERKCQESLWGNYSASEDLCGSIMDYIEAVTGRTMQYDARSFSIDWDPVEQPMIDYFTKSKRLDRILEQIHVSKTTKSPAFEASSSRVGEALKLDNLKDYSHMYRELIERRFHLLVYAGEFDMKDGPYSQEGWLRRLKFPGAENFWNQSRSIYWLKDGKTVGGYYRESEYFTYLTVPKAGHYVPANNGPAAISMLQDYIKDRKLRCHAQSCSVATQRCEAMDNCSGHGTCLGNGECHCNEGWKGADCALPTQVITGGYHKQHKSVGGKWFSFAVDCSNCVLTIDTQLAVDIYISRGVDSDPNEFVNDIHLKSQSTTLRLDHEHWGLERYSVSIYTVGGINEEENAYIPNILTVSSNEKLQSIA